MSWVDVLLDLQKDKCEHIIVNLTGIRGSAPQVVGSKMIVTDQGLYWGTVGGGKIEAHCIEFAKNMLTEKATSQSHTWNLQTDIGMSCGGEVSLYFEAQYYTNWTVAIFGAGHVSQELCRVMSTWSCQLKVFDTREEWLRRLPQADNIVAQLSENLAKEVDALPKDTYLISMTQGHAHDVPILKVALSEVDKYSFVGVIGSELKGRKIKKELLEMGVDASAIERLICPIGLPIGNNTPPEIAISISAQLLSLRSESPQ